MDTGSLHKFHDTRNKNVLAITDSVHFNLLAADILVYQNRLIFIDFNSGLQILPQGRFLGYDLHGAAAQYKAGANQYGIADFSGGFYTGLDVGDSLSLGLGNVQGKQELFKGIPVFRLFYGIAIGADYFHTPISERLRQIDGRLPAQGGDDSLRLLQMDDVQHILNSEWLKI